VTTLSPEDRLPHGTPTEPRAPRIPLHTWEFATDPHRIYREARQRHGALAPVEIAPGVPATLVLGYHTAVRILNDPSRFPSDPRGWQADIPADCALLQMMGWRPNALYNDGAVHTRYRQPSLAAVDAVNPHHLHTVVERISISLINNFCEAGTADLITQYTFPLAFAVINALIGCTPELAEAAAAGMAKMVDATAGGEEMVLTALSELVALKRRTPGDDIASRLLSHPTGLDDQEIVFALQTLYGAGLEPQHNLIANTMLKILTDDRFAGPVSDGSLSIRDAIEDVLFLDPPMANFCITYPKQPILIDDVWLPAHQPVVISMTACNNDPAIGDAAFTGNRSQLSWGLGPHACPARNFALPIAQHAVDQLLDALPEIRLAGSIDDLTWRPGPFHRSLTALPVTFPSSPPLPGGE
jgi:cytochrome P450